ncbi:MAG: hypothetical protein KDD63_28450, partial [Bacteroidetes bacterium]|nr:hypothetical protein [Bacteroidota bacterium]
ITHTNNPLSVDWAHNAEAIYHQNQELLQKELNQQANFVLIQKDKIKEANDPQPYGSLITGYIIDNWEKAWEGTYFVVYRKKQKTDEP